MTAPRPARTAAVPGSAERNRPAATPASPPGNNALARAGIGRSVLPFTGLSSRALLLVAACLLCLGGWLLVWSGRVNGARRAG